MAAKTDNIENPEVEPQMKAASKRGQVVSGSVPADLYERLEEYRWPARKTVKDVLVEALEAFLDTQDKNKK